jgi:hypothetical protein
MGISDSRRANFRAKLKPNQMFRAQSWDVKYVDIPRQNLVPKTVLL